MNQTKLNQFTILPALQVNTLLRKRIIVAGKGKIETRGKIAPRRK